MSEVEMNSATEEHRFHGYTGNDIPWYVRLMWVLFWIFAVYYAIVYFLPAIRVEMPSAP